MVFLCTGIQFFCDDILSKEHILHHRIIWPTTTPYNAPTLAYKCRNYKRYGVGLFAFFF